MPCDGRASSGVLLVGEAPGETEARMGKPFIGAAGFYLDRVLKRGGLNRTTYAVHNVLSCRPPNNWLVGAPYEQAAITHCAPYLDRTIRDQNPKVLVALGNTALRRLVPSADGIARHRGFVLTTPDGRFVVPTFHPSYLLPRIGQENTSRFVGVVIRDLRRADYIAQHGFVRAPLNYLLDPPPDQFAMWIAECDRWAKTSSWPLLAFDIETPYKLKNKNEDDITDEKGETPDEQENGPPVGEPILRISFSYQAGTAVTVPWRGDYLAGIRHLLENALPKAVWNGVRFDVPVIESHGFRVGGRVYDFMWGFHVWQSDLPKGLEFASSLLTDLAPWKHLSDAQPAHYNAQDSDAQLRNGLALHAEMQATGQWDIFERHIVTLDKLLMEMGLHGVLIDRKAQDELREELERERDRFMRIAQTSVPESLKPRSEYKKLPDGAQEGAPGTFQFEQRIFEAREVPAEVKRCTHCGQLASNKTEHFKGGKKSNACKAAGATIERVPGLIHVYDEVEDFNPNSVQHLLAYAQHFKHPVPLNHQTKKPKLDKQAVETLARKYPTHAIYQAALGLRSVRKTLGTYVEGFRPDSKGLIHTTYGHHPSSLRLSSRNVNLQNVSHRGGVAYADRVRRTIIPRPGFIFVEADSAAIEAVMTGYFMGSAEYVALAKRGIHDYLNCFEHSVPFTDANILRSKGEWSSSRDRNKIVVHGTSYGMTPFLMHKQWPHIFPRVADAQAAQARFFAACPGLAEWQHSVRTFAHKNTFIENPWHYRHYFYDVFNKNTKGDVILGEDAKRCVSFLPQSSAAAFMKDNLIQLAESRFWPMPAIGLIHDSYCLEVREADQDEAVELLVQVLTRPIKEMNDLTIGCEVKVSLPDADGLRHWNHMVSVKKAA